MAFSPPTAFALPLALLALPATLAAQQDQAIVAGSRVVRCLKTLEKAPNYAFEGSMLSGTGARNVFVMQGQRKPPKAKTVLIQGVRTGPLLCWSRQEGKEVLARNGGRWAQVDRDGAWIAVRGPQGSWKNQQFTDPRFLAGRLREINAKIEWTILSGVTLDERPVRCYESTISQKNARLLFRSGALPAGGAMGGLGQIIMFGGGGRNIRMPETLRKVHIKIYEDPRTHMPLKIECEVFAKQNQNGAVRIAIGGAGAGPADDDEEDEEEGEKKPKPTFTYTLNFSKFGKAQATDLGGKAQKILGIQKAAPAAAPGNAKEPPAKR
jgi:hypothetical protein